MKAELAKSIILNISLVLAIGTVITVAPKKTPVFKGAKSLLAGLLLGAAGVLVMLYPYTLKEGVFFDVRTIIIGISGMFFGIVPTAIACLITISYRIFVGGAGMLAGVCSIIISALIGSLWRRFRYEKVIARKKYRVLEIYLTGVLIHVGMLACMFLLPFREAVFLLEHIGATVMTLYPVGLTLVGMLLLRQIDRTQLLERLTDSERNNWELFENSRIKMILYHPGDLRIIHANSRACGFYGWSSEKMERMKMTDLGDMTDEDFRREVAEAEAEGRGHLRFRHTLASGKIRNVDLFRFPYRYNNETCQMAIIHDTTERNATQARLKESEERLRVTLLSVGDGVITTDNKGMITLINRKAQQILNCGGEFSGYPIKSVFNALDSDTRSKIEEMILKVIETGEPAALSLDPVPIYNGSLKYIENKAAPIKNDNGDLIGVVYVLRDVTEQTLKQQQITFMGYHDGLTGLYNRAFFDEELKRLDTERNLPISIIIGDVNALKLTNDAFGHSAGDRLLKDMAERIRKACRKEDIVARWGGDEFIILLPKTDDAAADEICARIEKSCAEVKTSNINFSISLGHDTKTSADQSIDDVMKSAENYMYRKKSIESSGARGKTIFTILLALHEKNPREQLHSQRVSELCGKIGRALGRPQREIDELELAGLLHDIGKISIDERVLNKKGVLTQKEWSEIKRHPEIGYRILSSSNDVSYIADYVLKHHERLDGKGYPNGITGKDIPLGSRILSVADSYDAMTGERPYKNRLGKKEAINQLRENSGTQFDPEIVEVFISKVLGLEPEEAQPESGDALIDSIEEIAR